MKKRKSKESMERSLKAKNRLALSTKRFRMKRSRILLKSLRFSVAIKRPRFQIKRLLTRSGNRKESMERSLMAKNRLLALSMRRLRMKRSTVLLKSLRFPLAIKRPSFQIKRLTRSGNRKKQVDTSGSDDDEPLIYLDGSFIFHCFVHEMEPGKLKYMFEDEKVRLGTTECTWKELGCYVNSFSEYNISIVYKAMIHQTSDINCGHKDNLRAKECIMDLVRRKNKNKAFVATQDGSFLQILSENLIPVVVVERGDFALKNFSKNPVTEDQDDQDDEDDQHEKRLMDRLKFYEFKQIPVDGDGNCMLRALSEQMTHDEDDYEKVRAQLANQFQRNENLYKEDVQKYMDQYPEDFPDPTYSDFVECFSTNEELVPVGITLQAASDLFKAKIVYISSCERVVFQEFTPHDVDDPETVWYLSQLLIEDGHTDSVYPRRNPSSYCGHLYDLDTLDDN